MLADKEKLKIAIDTLYFPTQHFEKTESKKVETELIEKLESYKAWANKQIELI